MFLAVPVLALAFIAGLSTFPVWQNGWHSIPTTDIFEPTAIDRQLRYEELRLTDKGLRVGNRGWGAAFTGQVPKFDNPTPLDRAAGNWLKMIVTDLGITTFDIRSRDLTWREKLNLLLRSSTATAWETTLTAHVVSRTPELLSLRLDNHGYTHGVHGNHLAQCFNFQWRDGRMHRIKLAEFFVADSDWKTRLCGLLLTDLKRQKAASPLGGAVNSFKADEFKFTASPDGLGFYFDPGDVGPYAQGRFVVKVSFAELKDILNPDGPAKVLGVK
ncbi:MAG: DUF3298 domain-containing protein [Verrucomicrobia bacterium]|nr:DUF3298 domain-containing protein [Verrucomicrobiota bacterium]